MFSPVSKPLLVNLEVSIQSHSRPLDHTEVGAEGSTPYWRRLQIISRTCMFVLLSKNAASKSVWTLEPQAASFVLINAYSP